MHTRGLGVRACMLQGAGQHFSVGGNPYRSTGFASVPLPTLARTCRDLYLGFIGLRGLHAAGVSLLANTVFWPLQWVDGTAEVVRHVDGVISESHHASAADMSLKVRAGSAALSRRLRPPPSPAAPRSRPRALPLPLPSSLPRLPMSRHSRKWAASYAKHT